MGTKRRVWEQCFYQNLFMYGGSVLYIYNNDVRRVNVLFALVSFGLILKVGNCTTSDILITYECQF